VNAEVAVIGAGAAGLMAAIFAGRAGRRVVVYDGAKRIGAKILIAGGGRCNVTHDMVTADDFNGNRNAIAKVLRTFTVEETLAFFEDLGVPLKREETGKLFPVTDQARTVLDALLRAARDAGVEVRSGTRIESIDRHLAPVVIVATGGRSVPKTGSDGHGYTMVRALGHTVTETFPGLVPLVIEEPHWIKSLSGTSADVELQVRGASGRVLRRETGSLLMTHFGISGPATLDISRHWLAARRDDPGATLVANFLPGVDIESLLLDAARANPRATISSALRGRVAERILDKLAPVKPISQLPRQKRREVALTLTEMTIPVARDRGFDYAEVTAGGVPLSEIHVSTMQSRIAPWLYLCGEILDVDGKIGGYNFQWAWASGRLAGRSAASR
jgi:predicted Rossmann fold flavoprotein